MEVAMQLINEHRARMDRLIHEEMERQERMIEELEAEARLRRAQQALSREEERKMEPEP